MRELGVRAALAASSLLVMAGAANAADSFVHVGKAGSELASPFSGWVEGRYSSVDSVHDNAVAGTTVEGVDAGKWSLRGAANLRAGSFNIQVDVDGGTLDNGPYERTDVAGTVHAYLRPIGGTFAIGAFLRGTQRDFEDIRTDRPGSGEENELLYGGEIAYLAEFATLHLRAGIGTNEYGTDLASLEADRLHVGAGANFYIGENFRLDLDGTYDRVQHEILDVDTFTVDARANYRFHEKPVSVFAGYRYNTVELRPRIGGAEEEEQRYGELYAGAKLHFGTRTLQQEDRSGALWDTFTALP